MKYLLTRNQKGVMSKNDKNYILTRNMKGGANLIGTIYYPKIGKEEHPKQKTTGTVY